MPVPAQENRGPIDYRPAGAAAGAAVPGASLAQYYLHELPTYRRMVEQAHEIDTTHGDPQKVIRDLLKRLQPGDVAIGGLQPANDAITRFLVNASAATAGGPGAHGQIYGAPMVDSLNRPIQFLRHPSTGELFEASDGQYYGGGATRAMQERAAKLEKLRLNAQSAMEAHVKRLTGKDAPTDPLTFKKFVKQLARTNKDPDLRAAYNQLARASKATQQHSWDLADFGNKALSQGFTERVTIPTVHHGGWSPATHKIITDSVKAAPKGTISPSLREVIREYGPEATSVMGPTMRPVGMAVDAGDAVRKALSSAVSGNFNEAAEHLRNLPQNARDVYKHDIEKTNLILKARGSDKWQQKAHNMMDDVADGLLKKDNRPLLVMRPQLPKGVTAAQYQQGLGKMLPHEQGPYAFLNAVFAGVKNVFAPKINMGGQQGPSYFDLASKVGPDKAIAQMCSGPNAHHCGSLPAETLRRMGMRGSGTRSGWYLPNFLALEKGMAPVAVLEKAKMLKDLARMSKYRGAFGLGAMGLMGAVGYGATGLAQNAVRGPAPVAPPPQALPKLTPPAMPKPGAMQLGQYAMPAAALAGTGLALGGMYAAGRMGRKKPRPEEELEPAPA